MLPLSHRLLAGTPALIVALLIILSAVPMVWSGISLVPNIVWLATIALARMPNIAWPAWLAFALGLLEDVVFGTPLGSQAMVALLLLLAIRARPARVGQPLLSDTWAEAAILLIAAQVLLIVILLWVMPSPPNALALIVSAIVNIFWFPVIAWGAGWLALALPK